jgi:hypothetical protein
MGDMLVCALLLDEFCAGYDSASQAGGGTQEPIYSSQALLLEPRHGLPPPPPQIALRFAAQINLEGRQKIQATAPVGRVPAPHRGAAIATVYSRDFAFSVIQQIISELRLFFPVGTNEPVYLIHLCLLDHCRSG